jgi:hypothetical protein
VTLAPTIFDRIVTGSDVEQWTLDCLKTWSSTYLAELERQHGLQEGSLQRIRGWVTSPSVDKWPEDQLPVALLVSVGLAERPLRDGAGRYRGRWQMGLSVVCSARTAEQTHVLAMLYVAAHRALLLQRQSLDGKAAGVVWQAETYTDLPFDDTRSLEAGQALFTVEIEDITSAWAGPDTPSQPLDPDTQAWPLWPTVKTHTEQVKHVDEITQPQVTPYTNEEETHT